MNRDDVPKPEDELLTEWLTAEGLPADDLDARAIFRKSFAFRWFVLSARFGELVDSVIRRKAER